MPRVDEAHRDARAQLKGLLVVIDHQIVQRQLGVLHGIQRLHRRPAGTAALLVGPLGIALLNVGAVQQHDAHQLAGEAAGIDLSGVAPLVKQGDASGMVDMGMGSEHIIHLAGCKGQLVVVNLVPALLQAAVHQDPLAAGVDAVAAAGDRAGSTVKCQLHNFKLLYPSDG